jgi:hypothetical protein
MATNDKPVKTAVNLQASRLRPLSAGFLSKLLKIGDLKFCFSEVQCVLDFQLSLTLLKYRSRKPIRTSGGNIYETSKILDAYSGDSEESDARSNAAYGTKRCNEHYLANMSDWNPTARSLN